MSVSHRVATAALAFFLALAVLAGCAHDRKVTQQEVAAIALGTPRSEVLEQLGEPHGALSGMFGDIYTLDETQVAIIYYTQDQNGDARVSKVLLR